MLGCALIALGFAFAPSLASAQSTAGVWEPASSGASLSTPSSAGAPTASEVAEEASRAHRVPRRGLLTAGIAILGIAYAGAAAWGSYFLADLQLGVPSCNDQYGGWHFLPIAGPLIGMFAGGGCIPDTLHFEEAVLPVVFTVGQLVGLALLVAGAVGHVVDIPTVNITANADGALVQVGGSF